jgi:PAS domain S-box-containing protein
MDEHNTKVLVQAADNTQVAIVITEPGLEDNPIVFVNDAFQNLTLYSREYALGRNCRFLQGSETDPDDVAAIREGIESRKDFQVTITNHKADGTPFRNQLLVAPVFGEDGEISAYFGVQREVNGRAEDPRDHSLDLLRELQHRVKNHLAMVVSMIRMQAARKVTPESLKSVGRRVEALALLYDELFSASLGRGQREVIPTGAYLSRIATVIGGLQGRSAVRVNLDFEDIDLPVDKAARLGLLLSELLTNSLEHAFEGRDSGFVDVSLKRLGNGGVRLRVEDDGIGLPEGSDWPRDSLSVEDQRTRAETQDGALDTTGHDGRSGVGGSIILALTKTLGATLNVNRAMQGTIVTVEFEPEKRRALSKPKQGA